MKEWLAQLWHSMIYAHRVVTYYDTSIGGRDFLAYRGCECGRIFFGNVPGWVRFREKNGLPVP